ncbi:MAG: hydroxymethylbilane synthase [Chlamydiia bacterium]|nr:hydroxymethylbilane synthase [Chlamydiia bacterium]
MNLTTPSRKAMIEKIDKKVGKAIMNFKGQLQLKCAARSSNLARVQVREIEQELGLVLQPIFVETHGDLDLKTSLRALDKTDFFTREVDALVLSGEADLAIHSAKDLPEPLPEGLKCVYLSKGVDSRDALVMREGMNLDDVSIVGTSSERRDRAVREMKPDVVCKDIRGTIEARLEQLLAGCYDAVVIAEAALIRLELTHLNRLYLPGDTAHLQGKLAVIMRTDSSLR